MAALPRMDYFRDFPFDDPVGMNARLAAFAAEPAPTPALLLEAVAFLPQLRDRLTTTRVVQSPHGPITWVGYESRIWEVGEGIRHLMKRRRALRRAPDFWAAAEAVCRNRGYGKGRESFVMLLGQYGGRERVPTLLALLEDDEVAGHAVYALRLLAAPEAVAHAQRLLHAPRAWVRAEARKYLAKVGAPE